MFTPTYTVYRNGELKGYSTYRRDIVTYCRTKAAEEHTTYHIRLGNTLVAFFDKGDTSVLLNGFEYHVNFCLKKPTGAKKRLTAAYYEEKARQLEEEFNNLKNTNHETTTANANTEANNKRPNSNESGTPTAQPTQLTARAVQRSADIAKIALLAKPAPKRTKRKPNKNRGNSDNNTAPPIKGVE